MVDVFISYSRKDKERVARLARAIEDEGYDVWWDAELPPHQSYGDVITRKISEAKAAIVVWSPDAAASEWVRAEADMARNQKKLVQTALGEIIPPLPFNQIQYADIGDWEGEDTHDSWRKVKASLADLCGRNGPDASVASAHEPAFAPEPEEPAGEPEAPAVYEEYEEPARSKWPLFAGLGLGAIGAAIGAGIFLSPDVSDYESENDGEPIASIGGGGSDTPATASAAPDAPAPEAQRPEIPADWILATVDDPDGHSNVRARPSTSSDIVSQVQVGETFRARRESGKWWPVELSDGTKGFIAKHLIRVKGSADSAPPEDETPPPQTGGSNGMLLPNSSNAALTASDLSGLNAAQLRIARNEIFARQGFIFQDADLTAHFSQFSWYQPSASSFQLSQVEQANIQFIQNLESAASN